MLGFKRHMLDGLSARRIPLAGVAGAVAIGVVLSACTATANDTLNPAGAYVAGFWPGLWEGIIAPIAFIVSLFNDKVGIYEIHNNGGWYNFGFLIGASMVLGGGGAGGARSARRRPRG